jgi:predicted ATP-grasp superfamily ATP-dependent carboligase
MWQAAGISMRPITAVTMIAPNTTLGVYWNNGIRKRSVTITVTDITIFEAAVFAPALLLTAEREKAPEIYSLNAVSMCFLHHVVFHKSENQYRQFSLLN